MNILPKKRWHVRNKDNVARVRRDEQRAKEEEEEAEKRKILAEKEAKIEILRRKKAREKESESIEEQETPAKHFNFFKEFEEESKGVEKTNKEYEKEKKQEKEEFEKKIGLLTYLGQSVSKDSSAWYLQNEKDKKAASTESLSKIEERKKHKMDPMQDVERYLKEKSKRDGKEKDKKKKKKKYKELIGSASAPTSTSNIEILRAKRLKREKEEKARADQLLRAKSGKSAILEEKSYTPSRYSSQYHPELVRKPRDSGRVRPY